MIRLETERLILRGREERGVAPFAAMNADPTAMEHFPATLTEAETRLRIAWFTEGVAERATKCSRDWCLAETRSGATAALHALAVERQQKTVAVVSKRLDTIRVRSPRSRAPRSATRYSFPSALGSQ